MCFKKALLTFLLVNISLAYSTQRPSQEDDSNPLIDMASAVLQEALAQGNNGGSGLLGMASLLGNLMQDSSGKSQNGPAQILAGFGSLLSAAGGGGGGSTGGWDPSILSKIIELFTAQDVNGHHRDKRSEFKEDGLGSALDSILQLASNVMGNKIPGKAESGRENGFNGFLPMIMQLVNSFNGPEGQRTQENHKDHAWVLPPFLENLHVMWDYFSTSELASALWKKSGVNAIFQGFVGRDNKLEYDKLFESLNNQAFRRRWIKAATSYLADWAQYITNPELYLKYAKAFPMMLNAVLNAQGFPKSTFFDPSRPTDTISNLVDHVAQKHIGVKIAAREFVEPVVEYAREIRKLGQYRNMLQNLNSTELSDKLTDMINLEVIEPVLKVHRAYRYVIDTPHCDSYVLCQLNSHDPNEKLKLAGFKPGVIKFGSMAAAWFVSLKTKTPFWNLFATVTSPYNCEERFPVDCSGFHENEAKVTTDYYHNEL